MSHNNNNNNNNDDDDGSNRTSNDDDDGNTARVTSRPCRVVLWASGSFATFFAV